MAPQPSLRNRVRRRGWTCALWLTCWAVAATGFAQETAEELFRRGEYDAAMLLAKEEVDRGVWNEKWPKLLIRTQLTRGQYAAALATYQAAVQRYSHSLSLRLLGREVLLANNLVDQAEREADEIFRILQQSSSRFASAESLVAAGRYFVLRGEDARQVLTLFYDRVREADPKFLDAHLATAELAIQKGDFQVASQTLAVAQKLDPLDPRVGYLQARAWESSDTEKARAAIQESLKCNAHFAPSLLYLVDNAIDAERFDEAQQAITQVLTINPHDWTAWAYLAVIAHLKGDYEREGLMRAAALSDWSTNPGVDHLIGKKLSDNYRFEVGASYQRRALAFDTKYIPASYQLANDLLRSGDDEIGWKIAEEVSQADPYNVVVHNLMTLSDRLQKFTRLQAEGIEVRMDAQEAAVYGERVLALLIDAKKTLCEKYDVTPRAPIIVEIYPRQSDFAIRTFGLPGGDGFLGVCFGRVITANSPASQGNRPSNWASVLWHEFCHAVTLEKTRNRMPRWLSEGISVYEELCRDPSWGQAMTPTYREMLLSDDVPKVSELSGSFLRPKSALHLQFAYYQSNLVVRYLVETFGEEALKQLLDELGNGLAINDAISKTMRPIETIDVQFQEYATKLAQDFGKDADWARPESSGIDELFGGVTPINVSADNVWQLMETASEAIASEQFADAVPPLERLLKLGVVFGERDGPLEQLASAYRALDQPAKEQEILRLIDRHSSDSLESIERLVTVAREAKDWDAMLKHAQKWLDIQPLLPAGHEAFAEAAQNLGRDAELAQALQSLQQLGPVDPADVYLRLAKTQHRLGQTDLAKRNVIRALEFAPRYRDAHRLLLEIVEPIAPVDTKEPMPAPEASATEKAAAEQTAGEKPAAEKPATEGPMAEKSTDEAPVTQTPTAGREPIAEEAQP